MTGTGCDHEHDEMVVQAAQWLAEQPAGSIDRPIPELRRRFPLTAQQACEASARADRMRVYRRAHG